MINYSFHQLIKKGVHLGHYKWECDYKLAYYLLGLRNLLHIINLNYTLYVLRRVFYIISKVITLNQKVLSINNNEYNLYLNYYGKKKYYQYFLYLNQK